MSRRRVLKYHGLGNDFVLLDTRDASPIDAEAARWLCDRHRGVGADGVISLLASDEPGVDLGIHIFNADGSVAEMCGNGLRCVVRYETERRGSSLKGRALQVKTAAGLREGQLLPDGRVRISLGIPELIRRSMTLNLPGRTIEGCVISMGNPHFVLPPTAPGTDLAALANEIGQAIATHPAFERGTNVELATITGASAVRLVVYERGVGVTQACGTGAAAVAVALLDADPSWRNRPVEVMLPGGRLWVEIDWPGAVPAMAYLTGDAEPVFEADVNWDRP